MAGCVSWLAWPTFYPITAGPDLVHHLTLIHFLQDRQAMPASPAFGVYLGEMTGSPPGAHLLAAVTAGVVGRDGLVILHPLRAVATGVKVGLVGRSAARPVSSLYGIRASRTRPGNGFHLRRSARRQRRRLQLC